MKVEGKDILLVLLYPFPDTDLNCSSIYGLTHLPLS